MHNSVNVRNHFIYIVCILFTVTVVRAQKTVNTSTQLQKIASIQDLPRYIDDTKLLQVSSYDTTGGNNDGFSGKYSFIRKNPDSSLVIFEAKGKGIINRIWTPTPTEDTLDFYFGKSHEPNLSIKFSDLFSGKVFPFEAPLSGNEVGGYYCYVPIPFKDGCKIVFRGKKLEFYQIQHLVLPKKTKVENFDLNSRDAMQNALKDLREKWDEVGQDLGEKVHTDQVLQPGKSLTIAELKQGGRITGIHIENAESFEGLHKQIDLKITWDNEQYPAVYMPIADFFGYAFGKTSMQSLLLGVKENRAYSYLPMPFDASAKIELIYRKGDFGESQKNIPITADVFYTPAKRNPREEGKLYTFWNMNSNPTLGEPHVFLKGKGKGHYVATLLQAQGRNPGMTLFFEGDDVTTIDGEMRVHGTGSEDYFNGGWYALLNRWDKKISLPLHGSLAYSLPYARTGGYRLFKGDKMPFNQSIEHTIEHGPEDNNMPVDYISVAFYYADKPINTEQSVPTNKLTKVYVPQTFMLYPQLMKYSFMGKVETDNGLFMSNHHGQVRIDLSELPQGRYKLYVDIDKFPAGAEVSLWQRQKRVAENVSFYAQKDEKEDKKYFCEINIDDFNQTLTIRFKEENMKRNTIKINRLIFEKSNE